MAVKSKETLKTQSSETFYDNDLGGITPPITASSTRT